MEEPRNRRIGSGSHTTEPSPFGIAQLMHLYCPAHNSFRLSFSFRTMRSSCTASPAQTDACTISSSPTTAASSSGCRIPTNLKYEESHSSTCFFGLCMLIGLHSKGCWCGAATQRTDQWPFCHHRSQTLHDMPLFPAATLINTDVIAALGPASSTTTPLKRTRIEVRTHTRSL